MRRRELGLLVAVLGVLLAGVVAVPSVGDRADNRGNDRGNDRGDDRSAGPSGPSPTTGSSASPTGAPSPTGLVVSGVRASSFASGSGEVSLRLVVRVPGETVTGALVEGQGPLTVGAGGEVTGTVQVACASRRTPVELVVTTDAGRSLRRRLVLPEAAVDRACAPRTPGTPAPRATTRGS